MKAHPLNNLTQSFGVALCNRFPLLYGPDKIAAAGIASKISMIAAMMIVAFAFGAMPLVGYAYGRATVRMLLGQVGRLTNWRRIL